MNPINEQTLVLISKYKIVSADTDMEARLRLGALVNLLIQSAISSADSLGFGFEGLNQQQLFWVLSRLTVEICRPLKWYEEIEVETWPKNIEKILYLRDFLIRDKDQQIVARATSGWLAIDRETKRPKVVNSLHSEVYTQLKQRHALQKLPEKLESTPDGEQYELRTSYFDIDLNKHVTSTRYVDWMMDTLSVEFHKNNYPKHLSINYLKETRPNEMIRIIRQQDQSNQCRFEGINPDNAGSSFRGRIDF